MKSVEKTARSCRHYAMCKIDFLGTGVCASGPENHFVTYYPQGRMDLYAALASGSIPLTPAAVESAQACNLCGICDRQCYFVTGLRPVEVMRSLKELVALSISSGKKPETIPGDEIMEKAGTIIGKKWVSNDPAVLVCYSSDPSPMTKTVLPSYVVLPENENELASVIKLFNKNNIEFAVRGNGSSVLGAVMSSGAVIDLARMKSIRFDEKKFLVHAGAGVTAFELQTEAAKQGYRINAAEPAAMVCANINCSGLFSLFSASYGTGADNYADASFISFTGEPFNISDPGAPNISGFNTHGSGVKAICTSAAIRLHPVLPDEEGILVPFTDLSDAVAFARELALRRIGIGLGILGGEYLSSFLSPTEKLATEIKTIFTEKLSIRYLVLVIADKYGRAAVQSMGVPLISNNLFRTLALSLPSLKNAGWIDLIEEFKGDDPFAYLASSGFDSLAEAALAPSAQQITDEIPEDLRGFFHDLYSRREMTDLVWLNSFRILSSRMGREKHVVALIIYLPMDGELIREIDSSFRTIAHKFNLKNDFGFITPIDNGKRCVFEYDYYLDHLDKEQRSMTLAALNEAAGMIMAMSEKTGTVKWIAQLLNQGFSRKETFLYA